MQICIYVQKNGSAPNEFKTHSVSHSFLNLNKKTSPRFSYYSSSKLKIFEKKNQKSTLNHEKVVFDLSETLATSKNR
jgi:hypothetical protein